MPLLKEEKSKELYINEPIASLFEVILKEIIDFAKRFPKAEIYINRLDLFLYPEIIIIVYDYMKLTEEEEKYFFGFEYRLNREIQSVVGKEAPFVEVIFVRALAPYNGLVKIA